MKTLDVITFILLVIGGLNWGLVGLFNFNLVGAITGGDLSTGARVIYGLVALSAIYELLSLRFITRRWRFGRYIPT
jgi:uncharacterized membrane protein YuzA (DUF378 family)